MQQIPDRLTIPQILIIKLIFRATNIHIRIILSFRAFLTNWSIIGTLYLRNAIERLIKIFQITPDRTAIFRDIQLVQTSLAHQIFIDSFTPGIVFMQIRQRSALFAIKIMIIHTTSFQMDKSIFCTG